MNNKTYKTIAIIALVVSIVGLVSFVGGIKPVNIGTFVFPLLVSGFFLLALQKEVSQFQFVKQIRVHFYL